MILTFDNLSESASTKLLQRFIPICEVVTCNDLIESFVGIESMVVLSYGISAESAKLAVVGLV